MPTPTSIATDKENRGNFEQPRHLENHTDIENAKRALAELGENVPAQEIWKQLGLSDCK